MPKSLNELIEHDNPAWPEVKSWIGAAVRPVQVLPKVAANADQALQALQVSTKFTLGAVAWETAGIVVDGGWLRILGSGSDQMRGSLLTWNGLGGRPRVANTGGALLVAHDAVGGMFALDGGALGDGSGGAFYFAPDSLSWEELGRGYTELLHFFFTGDLGAFYESLRWPTWKQDVALLSPDQSFSLAPPPWTKEGSDVSKVSRRVVAAEELFRVEFEVGARMGSVTTGTKDERPN